jgi:hypothetical protein
MSKTLAEKKEEEVKVEKVMLNIQVPKYLKDDIGLIAEGEGGCSLGSISRKMLKNGISTWKSQTRHENELDLFNSSQIA